MNDLMNDLKALECGCNVVLKRYSNPFHRAYYIVNQCEFHKQAEAENASLKAQLAALSDVARQLVSWRQASGFPELPFNGEQWLKDITEAASVAMKQLPAKERELARKI